jgi:hypothetical protein
VRLPLLTPSLLRRPNGLTTATTLVAILSAMSSTTARRASARAVYGSYEGTDGLVGITRLDPKDTHGHGATCRAIVSTGYGGVLLFASSGDAAPGPPEPPGSLLRRSTASERWGIVPTASGTYWGR